MECALLRHFPMLTAYSLLYLSSVTAKTMHVGHFSVTSVLKLYTFS